MTFVVVTGASRGIGRATARRLGRRGVRLALLGRASEKLAEAAEELSESGVACLKLECDLAQPAEILRAAMQILNFGEAPDAVIHNAGVLHRGSVEQLPLAAWEEQFAVNLRAPFLLTQALLPSMLARKSGRFVFVSSISATLGTANASAYNASKWGLTGFTKSLAEELRDTGLTATAILPGSVATDMLKGTGFEPRMSAEDVATTLEYYALDAPLAHNGAVIEMFGI